MDVDEVEEGQRLTVKTKAGALPTLEANTSHGVRQLKDELAGAAETKHWRILMLPNVSEPWDDEHPELALSLAPIGEASEVAS